MVEPFEMRQLALLATSSADFGRSPAQPGCRFFRPKRGLALQPSRCGVLYGLARFCNLPHKSSHPRGRGKLQSEVGRPKST